LVWVKSRIILFQHQLHLRLRFVDPAKTNEIDGKFKRSGSVRVERLLEGDDRVITLPKQTESPSRTELQVLGTIRVEGEG
jgi:hypothetical protein